MKKSITVDLGIIDFTLLRKQKENLLFLMNSRHFAPPKPTIGHLQGVVNLIDRIQDEAVDTLGLSERAVFGKLRYVDDLLGTGPQGMIPGCPTNYEEDRYNIQRQCAEAAEEERTTIVRAPAGFGKTMVGLLWARLRGGRSIWVCPRNAVADAVYDNVVSEVQALGLTCSVELYRTGKRQKGLNDHDVPEFGADIVITNIDAVLSPMVNNRTAGRMFAIFGANVILDEFHEFVSDSPMFAAFITYMRARHRVAGNCKTLLLSATPMNVEKLWGYSPHASGG